MRSIQKLLFTAVVAMGFSATHLIAEEIQTSTEVQIKELDQKIATIQAQIDELKKKGIANLSDDEFVKFDELTDQLLATMRAKTAAMKAQTQKAYSEMNENLASIKKSLPPSNSSK